MQTCQIFKGLFLRFKRLWEERANAEQEESFWVPLPRVSYSISNGDRQVEAPAVRLREGGADWVSAQQYSSASQLCAKKTSLWGFIHEDNNVISGSNNEDVCSYH